MSLESISAGTFLCQQVNLPINVELLNVIESVYGKSENTKIIVSNMLLDKYQLGTKKSELQKRILQ